MPVQFVAQEADYTTVVASLYDSSSSNQGMEDLKKLSDEGDAKATYLLSRLYYNYKPTDFCPDSIRNLQQLLHVSFDDIKAHQLLKKSVEQDGEDYHSLYELACDYWKGEQRTTAVKKRHGEQAKYYFDKAREYALEANDQNYVSMIDCYLDDYRRWTKNLRDINMKNQ